MDDKKLTEEEKVLKDESTVGDNKERSNSSPKWLNAFKSLNLFSLTALVIGVLVLLLGIGVYAITSGDEEGPTIDSNLIQHQIETVSELTTTKYHYTNAGAFEDQNTFYGWNVPFTKKNFILTYSGIIHAGIDMEAVNVDVRDAEIYIDIPDSQILSHELDEVSIKVLDEENSIFNPIKIEDYQAFAIEQEKVVEEQATANGLLEEANKQAQQAIMTVLKINPEIEDGNYTIVFQ